MTKAQETALRNPLARANFDGGSFRELKLPWSIILTVNK